MLLCRESCVDILARSSCTISMQKFEVGEIYNVGRPAIFFPLTVFFLSAVTTSRESTTIILYFLEIFGETEFRQRLRVGNGTTNSLLSLII